MPSSEAFLAYKERLKGNARSPEIAGAPHSPEPGVYAGDQNRELSDRKRKEGMSGPINAMRSFDLEIIG